MTTITPPSLPMPFLSENDLTGLTGHLFARGAGGSPASSTEQASRLHHGGQTQDTGRSPEAVGKGFEEIFASILVKQMRQTVGEGGMFGHDPGDVLGGMFDHFLSQHIAKSGSLGIGKMIQKHLEKRSDKP